MERQPGLEAVQDARDTHVRGSARFLCRVQKNAPPGLGGATFKGLAFVDQAFAALIPGAEGLASGPK